MEDYKICGIVGAAGILTANEEKAFKILLVFDTIRGEDSTGIASVAPNGDVIVSKSIGTPYDLFSKYTTERLFARANRVLIGHNRSATQGAVSSRNAHPFEFDSLVGVHNGTLKERYKLNHTYKYQVDSEQLYANIDEDGEKVVIPKVVGAYALVWWDKHMEVLKVIRNKERPLYYVFTEDGKNMFWASEEWMLSVALSRCNIKHRPILPIQEDQLYTFDVGVNPVEKFEAIKIDKEELKQDPLPAATIYGSGGYRSSHGGPVIHRSSQQQQQQQQTQQAGTTVSGQVGAPWKEDSLTVDPKIGEWACVTFPDLITHSDGNKFLTGYDQILKCAVRLYNQDLHFLEKYKGRKVEGKIMGKVKESFIYLLNPASIIDSELDAQEKLAEALSDLEEIGSENVTLDEARGKEVRVVDHNNREVTPAAFLQRYGNCSNCGANILFGDIYKPVDYNSCLCADCVELFQD